MEENSQSRDGSGDTGAKTAPGHKPDVDFNPGPQCEMKETTTHSEQTAETPGPGARGDVGTQSEIVNAETAAIKTEISACSKAITSSEISQPDTGANIREETVKDDSIMQINKGQTSIDDSPDDAVDKQQNVTVAVPVVTEPKPVTSEGESVELPDSNLLQSSPGTRDESVSESECKEKSTLHDSSTPYKPTCASNFPLDPDSPSVLITETQPNIPCSVPDQIDRKGEIDSGKTLLSNIHDSSINDCEIRTTEDVSKPANYGDNEQDSVVSGHSSNLSEGVLSANIVESVQSGDSNSGTTCQDNHSAEDTRSSICTESVDKSTAEVSTTFTSINTVENNSQFPDESLKANVLDENEKDSSEAKGLINPDDQTAEEMEVDPGDQPAETEDAGSDVASIGNNRKRHGSGSSVATFDESDIHGAFPAANVFEYQWPQETGAEWYMLQEQISEFLAVKSFKRKYPDLQRRAVDMNEKVFLKDRGVVSETQCDLGLTALKSEEVLDLMIRDCPMRYREYAAVLHEKERQTISDKHREYDVPKFEKSKLADYMKKAVKSAAEFNVQFQRERREDRRAYFDLQTMAIHYPQSKYKVAPPECTKVGSYPVALIPGQFQDYYKTYTSSELKYLPVGTAVYGPPKKFKDVLANPTTADTSEDSADDSGEDQGGSDSGSDDGDSSEAESMGVAPLPSPAPVEDIKPATPNGASKTDKQKPPEPVVPTQEEPKKDKKEEKEGEKMCRICKTGEDKVKGKLEDLVQCSECKTLGHPKCLELTTEMIAVIKTYPWQCMECKTCVECMDPYDEDKMMFCDRCDRGYHTFCVGVKSIPTGRWECRSCRDIPSKPKKSRRQTRQNGVPSPKPAVSN